MVVKKTISCEAEVIKNNSDYIQKYTDLLYLRGVVGGMIAFAEQNAFQDILGSNERRSRDYDDYGVNNRSEFITKLKNLKETFIKKEKAFTLLSEGFF